MDTATDIDADGLSIATQREFTARKARDLGAIIDKEFIEPGNSALSIDKRPKFKELLKHVMATPGIDYVIIYMRSRAFRNLGDAVITKRHLAKLGIKLVSARENFGEGYMADAMEAVTDIFNELESRRNGEDVKAKMRYKMLAGGYNGRAKVGYLNVRESHNGKLFNTIALDPERAPLVRQVFELYATGDYTQQELHLAAVDLGLTQRPTPQMPYPRPVGSTTIENILSDPFFAGWVQVDGRLIKGRHEAIISQALFDRVQDVLEARSRNSNRDRVLYHYLKGLLVCGRCAQAGRANRLIYTQVKGRSGEYHGYYLCRGRQKKTCDLRHLPVANVEDAVAEHYQSLPIADSFVTGAERAITDALREEQAVTEELQAALRAQLSRLATREERLIDLAADGALDRSKITTRANQIAQERARIEARLTETRADLQIGATRLREALELARHLDHLFLALPDDGKHKLTRALFDRLEVDEGDYDITVSGHQLKAPFNDVFEAATAHAQRSAAGHPDMEPPKRTIPCHEAGDHRLVSALTGIQLVGGSSTGYLVGADGFEPPTARV
ncbi:recombinase family protein [Nakamurella multipartita]